jgi:hypothetical protein
VTSRNVLLVALPPVSDDEIHDAIEARKEEADVSVLVVAPAASISTLQWLTGAEDEARAEAEELADRAADAVEADVQTEVGDRDPLLAVEDALREFPADEIVLAGRADSATEARLRGFGLPVARLDGTEDVREEVSGAQAFARDVTRGRASKTPAVLLAAVVGVVFAAMIIVTLIAFFVASLV